MTLPQIANHGLAGGLRLEVYRAPSGETTATLHSPTCTIEAHHTMTGNATIANALMMSWAANTLVFAASVGSTQELLMAARALALQAQELRQHAQIQSHTTRA